jgi:hypothetical protein
VWQVLVAWAFPLKLAFSLVAGRAEAALGQRADSVGNARAGRRNWKSER